MEETKNYNENNTIDDFYFNNDMFLAILSGLENTEDRMYLYKQYFGNPAETSYVPLGSILTCSKGAGLSRLGASEVAQVFVGNNIPVLTCKDREVGSNIFSFGICNCRGDRTKCNPVIPEDWKQKGYNRAMICRADSDKYAYALKSNAISVCTVGGYIKVTEVSEPALRNIPEEEPVVLGSPDYMDELQDFLDNYQATEGYKFAQGASQMVAAKGIQKVMDDVNTYGDTGKIPDDYWLTLCKKFNSLVMIYGGVYEELHFFRNKLNRAPKTLDEMIVTNKALAPEKKWRLLPVGQSIYHMYGKDGEYNLKFVSADGLFEGVYDKAGNLLTELNDPINMGTYNNCDPANAIQHALLDVWPYDNWGNVPGVLKPELPFGNTDKFNANKDAQKHYDNIKNQM